MSYTGRCACAAVRLSVEGEPLGVGECWCWQCRQRGAGSPSHNAIFPQAQVSTTGALTQYSYPADSGAMSIQSFCAICGTLVFGQSSAHREVIAVKLGVLDEPHDLSPTMAIWTSEAPAWAVIDPALPQFPRSPEIPGHTESSS